MVKVWLLLWFVGVRSKAIGLLVRLSIMVAWMVPALFMCSPYFTLYPCSIHTVSLLYLCFSNEGWTKDEKSIMAR